MSLRLQPVSDKVQWTYDLAQYGFELKQYLRSRWPADQITPALASAQYQNNLHSFNGSNHTPILPHDIYMSAENTAAVANEADDTAYDELITLHSHATGHIAHLAIVAGFCENVSAFTSGTITLASVRFTITTWKSAGMPLDTRYILASPTSAFSALGATGAQIFSCYEHLPPDVRMRTVDSQPITIRIQVNETDASFSGTRQVGLMPAFPVDGVLPASITKAWTKPQVIMNIKPGLGSVDFIGRD